MQSAFHAEGEVAVARAVRETGGLQVLSTASARSLDEVIEARVAREDLNGLIGELRRFYRLGRREKLAYANRRS